jgi:general transcription factor 3C polypeptide 3 (transcription factor C subunit 4)
MDDDDAGHISDADSDVLEWQADVAKLDASIAKFVAEQRGLDPDTAVATAAPAAGHGGIQPQRRRRRREPRAQQLPGDIKHLLSHATGAFLDGDFDRCMTQLFEIIRQNAEIAEAWKLLAAVLDAVGRRAEAVMSLVYAAHLDPGHAAPWIEAAELALEGLDDEELGGGEGEEEHEGEGEGEDRGGVGAGAGARADAEREKARATALNTARLCYSAAVRAEPRNVKVRMAKADILLAQGNAAFAVHEYARILKLQPHDIFTVRNMSDAALDVKATEEAVEKAKDAYRAVIYHAVPGGTFEDGAQFMWSDIRVYLALLEALGQWGDALHEVRSLSRWLLGRMDEAYWDLWTDDREWDAYDEPRRVGVPDFDPGRYREDQYGLGLPTDLRAKMFVYRSKIGGDPYEVEVIFGPIFSP